jgi:hypothetical protein
VHAHSVRTHAPQPVSRGYIAREQGRGAADALVTSQLPRRGPTRQPEATRAGSYGRGGSTGVQEVLRSASSPASRGRARRSPPDDRWSRCSCRKGAGQRRGGGARHGTQLRASTRPPPACHRRGTGWRTVTRAENARRAGERVGRRARGKGRGSRGRAWLDLVVISPAIHVNHLV